MSLTDTVSENKKKKTTTGEGLFIKPCTTKLPDKAAAMSLTDTVYEKNKKKRKTKTKKTGEVPFIKPCTTKLSETVSKRSKKKSRLTPQKLVEEDEDEEEEEDDDIAKIKFKRGHHVDVEVLLSSKSRSFLVTSKGGEEVPIAALAGKYVLVCCFYVPFDIDDSLAQTCQSIEALYNELTFKGIAHQVKLVVVLKIAPGFGEAEFDAFFSWLPINCLAIPFADSKSRDKLCKSFGFLTQADDDDSESPCLIVHPNGKVLQFDSYLLTNYGARSFPFTKKHIADIERQDDIIRERLRYTESPIFLEELLQCDYLSRIASENDYIPTSSLNDTVVAIYLCYDKDCMKMLQDLHQKCFDKGFKFEVILIPLSFLHPYETPSFHDRIKQDALKHPRSSSWWTFPYDDKVYRNLWRILFLFYEDDLLFLPHGRCPGDFCGKEIATDYGISVYPFTRNTLINKEVSKLRSFTLKDLLGNTGMWPDLENKNVLLYLDSPGCDFDGGRLFKTLKRDYHKIKAKYADSEVVFVTVQTTPQKKQSRISEMEWPILPLELCESVANRIGLLDYPSVVAFGRDGKILSQTAHYRIPVSTSSESPFDDTLSSDVEDDFPSQ